MQKELSAQGGAMTLLCRVNFYSEHVTFSSFAYYINRKCSKFAKY